MTLSLKYKDLHVRFTMWEPVKRKKFLQDKSVSYFFEKTIVQNNKFHLKKCGYYIYPCSREKGVKGYICEQGIL